MIIGRDKSQHKLEHTMCDQLKDSQTDAIHVRLINEETLQTLYQIKTQKLWDKNTSIKTVLRKTECKYN